MTDITGIMVDMATGFWMFLPAMIPNSFAAIFGKNSKVKMDFGRYWRGKRIFGDGKSWTGFFGGAISGILFGLITISVANAFGMTEEYFRFTWTNVGILCTLSFGALLGDLCGAFAKRRVGLERGQKAPILDQYDFVIGSILLTILFFPRFIIENYVEGRHIITLIFILLVTFFIHRFANITGYKLGIKKEPW